MNFFLTIPPKRDGTMRRKEGSLHADIYQPGTSKELKLISTEMKSLIAADMEMRRECALPVETQP